jgi:hypothetical protein
VEHGPEARTAETTGAFLGELDELKGVVGPVSVQHLTGHPRKDIRAELVVAARVHGPQREPVVILRPALKAGVPRHGRHGLGELPHDP